MIKIFANNPPELAYNLIRLGCTLLALAYLSFFQHSADSQLIEQGMTATLSYLAFTFVMLGSVLLWPGYTISRIIAGHAVDTLIISFGLYHGGEFALLLIAALSLSMISSGLFLDKRKQLLLIGLQTIAFTLVALSDNWSQPGIITLLIFGIVALSGIFSLHLASTPTPDCATPAKKQQQSVISILDRLSDTCGLNNKSGQQPQQQDDHLVLCAEIDRLRLIENPLLADKEPAPVETENVQPKQLIERCVDTKSRDTTFDTGKFYIGFDEPCTDTVIVNAHSLRQLILQIIDANERVAQSSLHVSLQEQLHLDIEYRLQDGPGEEWGRLQIAALSLLLERLGGRILRTLEEPCRLQLSLKIPLQHALVTKKQTGNSLRQQKILLMGGQTSLPLMRQWGAKIHTTNSPAQTIQALLNANDDHSPFDTLIVDLENLPPGSENVITTLNLEPALAKLRTLLIGPEKTAVNWKELMQRAGYARVLNHPLDKTILFNTLQHEHTDQHLPQVTQLFDRYLSKKSNLPPLEILLADTSETNLKLLQGILDKDGHRLYTTHNGEQALDAMTTHRFDIILLDLDLPDLDAIELTKIYRLSHPVPMSSPILLLTNDADSERQREAKQAGADALIARPLNPGELLDTIARIINQGNGVDDNASADESGMSSADQATQELPLLDRQTLEDLEHLGNGIGFVEELISNFNTDIKNLLDSMRTASRHNDTHQFRDLAHAIKGSASGVGANALFHLAARATMVADRQFPDAAPRLLAQLEGASNTAHDALLEYIDERHNTTASSS